ncbi:hemerythrin domain-containing protein [Geobacter sp. DSM 9736]|uniref:hemerythrin domain-containing protein n=1 Tax=Geobacter sp. DSM 9736 TaxID=1277350 RepID=UPI000B50D912|nr:hemerythrin domain-containing protein [Geobacter sp. DSM 9736]SNB47499.1 Hemerythrin HHE cation binding domain-containing protein [Geobacter sp. DSM 9736]
MAQQLFELLKKDHRLVEQLMDKLVEGDEEQRQEVFERLNSSLTQHMQLEEKYFYPLIKDEESMQELVEDALHEHQETKKLLQKLNKTSMNSDQWMETLEQMQEGVLHHVEDEEEQIFPQCKEVLSDAQLKQIFQQVKEEKEQLAAAPEKKQKSTTKQPRKEARP